MDFIFLLCSVAHALLGLAASGRSLSWICWLSFLWLHGRSRVGPSRGSLEGPQSARGERNGGRRSSWGPDRLCPVPGLACAFTALARLARGVEQRDPGHADPWWDHCAVDCGQAGCPSPLNKCFFEIVTGFQGCSRSDGVGADTASPAGDEAQPFHVLDIYHAPALARRPFAGDTRPREPAANTRRCYFGNDLEPVVYSAERAAADQSSSGRQVMALASFSLFVCIELQRTRPVEAAGHEPMSLMGQNRLAARHLAAAL